MEFFQHFCSKKNGDRNKQVLDTEASQLPEELIQPLDPNGGPILASIASGFFPTKQAPPGTVGNAEMLGFCNPPAAHGKDQNGHLQPLEFLDGSCFPFLPKYFQGNTSTLHESHPKFTE